MLPPQNYGALLEVDLYEEDMKCDDVCMGCNGLAQVYYEPKYHGFRAKCVDCSTNWAIS